VSVELLAVPATVILDVEAVESGTNFSTPAVTVRRSYVICAALNSTVADVLDEDVVDIFECQ